MSIAPDHASASASTPIAEPAAPAVRDPVRSASAWQRLVRYEALVDRVRGEAAMLPVRRAQMGLLLAKFSLAASAAAAAFAVVVWGLFYWMKPSAGILLWAVLVHAVQAVRYVQTRRLLARGPVPDAKLGEALRDQTFYLWLLGSAWGLAPWLVMTPGDTASMALMIVFIVSMMSSAAAVLSSHRQTVAAFHVPAAVGLISALAWSGGVMGWLLVIGLTQYAMTCLKWTFQQVDLLVDSLEARFEKEELARRLAVQVEIAEASSREKSRFLASASHDLRQPLHAVSLFTAVLEHANGDPAQRQTVERLGHSVRMLAASLDGMLDVSRLDAGAVQPRIEAVPVHPLFVSLQNTYGMLALDKGLRLRIRAPGDLHVLSDRALLERLLGNLLDNAIKYTEQGGVLVAARPTRARHGRAMVCFEVYDTGIGLDPAQHASIFEEFYQVDNPQRDRSRGLGLGLSIVRRLSQLLQHPMALRSQPRRGSRFSVLVPAVAAVAAGPAVAHHAPATATPRSALPRRVLVVDDEADVAAAMAAWLATQGCETDTASDAGAARRVLAQRAVDAVVCDVRLPGPEDGLAFVQSLRREQPGLRCLLVTGETAPERMAAIRDSGIACLYKPVLPEQLAKALARA